MTTTEPLGWGLIMDTGPAENLYVRSVRLFHQAVHGAGDPAATADVGVRSLAIALAVRASAQTGRRVPVKYPDIPPADRVS